MPRGLWTVPRRWRTSEGVTRSQRVIANRSPPALGKLSEFSTLTTGPTTTDEVDFHRSRRATHRPPIASPAAEPPHSRRNSGMRFATLPKARACFATCACAAAPDGQPGAAEPAWTTIAAVHARPAALAGRSLRVRGGRRLDSGSVISLADPAPLLLDCSRASERRPSSRSTRPW